MRYCFFIISIMIIIALSPNSDKISGSVTSTKGPIENALVRIKGTEVYTYTNQNGYFTLSNSRNLKYPIYVTAWSTGYYINGVQVYSDEKIEIHLEKHTDSDNPNYSWLPSTAKSESNDDKACSKCHSGSDNGLSISLPVDEWLEDAHSKTVNNPRFVSMYEGTDLEGNKSPFTRYGYNREYGSFPLRPDKSQPYYGPGYKLDFPENEGNCAACHAPLAAVNDPYGIDPTDLTGVYTEGISCDFCHKIWDVIFDPNSGLPYNNMPGVLSYNFRRPGDGHQFFAGPLDDVAPGEDTYLPLQSQSIFCAPCHYSEFWGISIYNSFGEWLDSPYSNPDTGQTCQDCHMPQIGATQFATTAAGGIIRDPSTIFSHKMPGANDKELLQNAVTLNVVSYHEENEILVGVEIINDKTGHHVPTDSPLRQLILLVKVTDQNDKILKQIEGSVVPSWGGIGDSDLGYYAGHAGKGFAKILMELWTEISPTGAYWNPTRIVNDNRIPAMESDKSNYVFQILDNSGPFKINVELYFRHAYIDLMHIKGWDNNDILMENSKFVIK